MAIRMRRGLKESFIPSRLLPGEFAVATDTGNAWYCYTAGKVKQIATSDDLRTIQEFETTAADWLSKINTAGAAQVQAVQTAGASYQAQIADLQAHIGYTDEDIYGLEVDYENKTCTRLAGAVGKTPGAGFDACACFGGRKRCNLSDDGVVNAYYGQAGYIEDGTNGQVMVEQPKVYYKVVPLKLEPQSDGIGYHLRKARYYVSATPKLGFKLHPAFFDGNKKEVNKIYLSAYEGSIFDVSASAYVLDDSQIMAYTTDLFCSIAGAKPASGKTQDLTRPKVEQMCKNRGAGWHSGNIKSESLNQLLMIVEMGTMNLQSAIANGVVSVPDNPNTENNSIVTGGTSNLGNNTGMADGTNGLVSVTYRGVENPWGNIWKHINGINIWGDGTMGGGQPFVADDFVFNESKRDGNYKPVGFTVANANGYISAMGYGGEDFDWLFFPAETLGNSSLPVGDYFYATPNLNGYRIARLGGSWANGGNAGWFCWNLNGCVGDRDRIIGGRLVYIPTAA